MILRVSVMLFLIFSTIDCLGKILLLIVNQIDIELFANLKYNIHPHVKIYKKTCSIHLVLHLLNYFCSPNNLKHFWNLLIMTFLSINFSPFLIHTPIYKSHLSINIPFLLITNQNYLHMNTISMFPHFDNNVNIVDWFFRFDNDGVRSCW